MYRGAMSRPTHNLDIQTYSLEELLSLFGLTAYNISTNDLRQAKKRVSDVTPG